MAEESGKLPARAGRWLDRLNRSRHPLWIIGVFSFFETIIIPIPIELILVPMMAANRARAWLIATIAFAGCILAAIVGYGVGMMLYESVGRWFLESMGYEDAYQAFRTFFDSRGFLAILVVGIVPIPFQIAMITAGIAGYPFLLFVLAAGIARGLRYYGLAWLVIHFGRRAQALWKRHAVLASLGAAALVLGLWLAGQYAAGRIV